MNPFAIIRKKVESVAPTTTVDGQMDLRTNMKRQVSLVDEHNTTVTSRRTVMISPLKRTREDEDADDDDDEPVDRRRVQVLNVNQEIRRATGLFSYEEEEEEPKRNGECTELLILPGEDSDLIAS